MVHLLSEPVCFSHFTKTSLFFLILAFFFIFFFYFIVCFSQFKFEPLLADLISILGGERGRSYSLGLGPKTGSKCFKLICICMDAAMTEFKEDQGPALKASLDSLPALAWAGTLLCIAAGRFRPSHQEVASQCQELPQLATKTFEWPVLLDRQKVCPINYLQVLFFTGPPTCSTPNHLWKILFSTTYVHPPFFVTSRTRQVQQWNSKHRQVSGEASTLLLRKTSKVRLGSFTPTENLRDLISLDAKRHCVERDAKDDVLVQCRRM